MILPAATFAQPGAILPALIATTSGFDATHIETKLDQFVATKLKSVGQQSEMAALQKVFNKTQKEFLHQYISYSGFEEIFSNGRYDCLTATSLFAVVLDRMHFNYEIVETNYHIFILVRLTDREVLLETTDRFGGFVTEAKEIENRIGTYRKGITEETGKVNAYHYTFDLFHAVDASQLPGLLYYNMAVKAYNADEYEKCASLLEKAYEIYDTPRISEFSAILLKAVLDSDLDSATKQKIVNQFRPLLARRFTVIAARD